MPVFPGFCGPSNRQRSRAVDCERTVNFYMELSNAGTPKVSGALYPTPGLRVYTFLGSGAVKGLFAQDGRAFGVGGAGFYEILPSRNTSFKGTVAVSGLPATMASNGATGHQIFITAGGNGYIYDLTSDVFTEITDPAFPTYVVQGLFFDGYFVALDGDTGKFVISDLYDGLAWNGLDFGLESQFSDKIVAMTRTHDNLWLFGTRNTAPWYDSGDASFPFQPVQGSLIEHGIGAPFSAIELDNTVWWLGQDEQGSGVVWRANGYTPVRVSTHAVEYALAGVQTYQGALAYGYQEQGHTFYVLYVPGLPTTWVYDIASDQWHERAHWDIQYGRYFPHVGVNHCFTWGRHLVGDRQSGAVYEQSLAYEDNRLILVA